MGADEESQLQSVALQTASSIFRARQRAEEQLVRVREAFEILRQSMAQMTTASEPHDLAKVLELITRSLVDNAGMDGCMISLLMPDERCPTCRGQQPSRGGPPMLHSQTYVGGDRESFLRHHRVPLKYRTVGYAISTREPLLINDLIARARERLANPEAPPSRFSKLDTPEAEDRWVIEHGFDSTAVYPLIAAGDQIVGVLTVVAKRPIGDDEFAHLGVFAHQATVSIRSAQMLEELAALRDRLLVENAYLKKEIETEGGFEEMIGKSPALAAVRRLIAQVAPADSTVLVLGETGTGKELVARAIHRISGRRDRALIKVNCAAISPSLVESELFGMSAVHSRERFSGGLVASSWPITARSFWTRSASCRPKSRSSSCVSCRSRSSSVWEGARPFEPMCDWSPPLVATSRPRSQPVVFELTSTIESTSSRFGCRRSVSGARTFRS